LEAIPLPARLFAVCDAYDAMTTDRPYQRARPKEAALAALEEGAGSQFDPQAVHEFAALAERRVVDPPNARR
jgi:HD-GYP domain-containing protein (c-di-GMP phosphodiesterase class II)